MIIVTTIIIIVIVLRLSIIIDGRIDASQQSHEALACLMVTLMALLHAPSARPVAETRYCIYVWTYICVDVRMYVCMYVFTTIYAMIASLLLTYIYVKTALLRDRPRQAAVHGAACQC
jgi:hypothetical protein